jgi:hypothetical protein
LIVRLGSLTSNSEQQNNNTVHHSETKYFPYHRCKLETYQHHRQGLSPYPPHKAFHRDSHDRRIPDYDWQIVSMGNWPITCSPSVVLFLGCYLHVWESFQLRLGHHSNWRLWNRKRVLTQDPDTKPLKPTKFLVDGKMTTMLTTLCLIRIDVEDWHTVIVKETDTLLKER